MHLNKKQQFLFWKLWAKACRAQGWDRAHGLNSAAVNAKRKAFLQECGFSSLTLVDHLDGFSLVKRELLKLDDVLEGAKEEVDPEIELRRKARWFIEHEIMPCLALYHPNPMAYLVSVAEDKTRWRKTDRPTRDLRLEDLSLDQLEQLKKTLSARLNGKTGFRASAGDSVHDMRTRARLKCSCSKCRGKVVAASLEPVAAGNIDPGNCPF